jgi:hypothetical protein
MSRERDIQQSREPQYIEVTHSLSIPRRSPSEKGRPPNVCDEWDPQLVHMTSSSASCLQNTTPRTRKWHFWSPHWYLQTKHFLTAPNGHGLYWVFTEGQNIPILSIISMVIKASTNGPIYQWYHSAIIYVYNLLFPNLFF